MPNRSLAIAQVLTFLAEQLFPLCQRTSRGNCRRRISLNGISRKPFSAIQDRGNRCSAICQTTTFVGSISSQSRSLARGHLCDSLVRTLSG